MSGRVEDLAIMIEARGISSGQLRDLQDELDYIERPPGLIGRLTEKVKAMATVQYRLLEDEIRESRELMGLLARAVRSGEELSPGERDAVRSQLLDLMKVVPAGLIAAVNAALPMPGTSVFTPWLLVSLGLMPSRWREAHLLARLEAEARRLREEGHEAEALLVEALEHDLEEEADARDRAAHEAALLTRWDANKNGRWDAGEIDEYRRAFEALLEKVRRHGDQRRWYLSQGEQVFGPLRLGELRGAPPDTPLLVCFDAVTGWICLEDLLRGEIRTDRFDVQPP